MNHTQTSAHHSGTSYPTSHPGLQRPFQRSMRSAHPAYRKRQQGVGLFTVLISLMLMGLLLAGGNFVSNTNQKAAQASHDRILALFAAEATLRDAEMDLNCKVHQGGDIQFCAAGTGSCRTTCLPGTTLAERKLVGFDNSNGDNCPNGWCITPPGTDFTKKVSVWDDGIEYGNITLAPYATQITDQLWQKPKYLIEGFVDPSGYPGFRITAKAWGRYSDTEVMVQEIYRPW